MKLAIVTPDYPPMKGGVARSVHRIADALGKRGHEVDVFVPHRLDKELSQPEIRVRDVGFHRVNDVLCSKPEPSPSWHVSRLGLLPQFYLAVRNRLLRARPELIHSFTLHPLGGVSSFVAKELEVPLVVSIRGSDLTANIFVPWLQSQIKQVLESADLVCPVSSDLGRLATNLVPSLADRSLLISNGCDPLPACVPRRFEPSTEFCFGAVASFRPKKDLGTILQAFASLVTVHPHCHLVVVGINDETERKAIEKTSRNTRVLPEQDYEEGIAIMGGFDALIISSVFEGCPNVLLESFSLGIPIIATSVGGMRDRITNGLNGLLFDPMSVEGLVSCMQTIMCPRVREQLAREGRKSVTTSDQEASEWEVAYAAAARKLASI